MTCDQCPASLLCFAHGGYCRLCVHCHTVHFNGGTDLYMIKGCYPTRLRQARGERLAWMTVADCPLCCMARYESLLQAKWYLVEGTEDAQTWAQHQVPARVPA